MNKLGWQLLIGGILVLSLFGSGFLAGWKSHKCPVTTSHTEYVVDTQWYAVHDYKPWVIRDTIYKDRPVIIPSNVDTTSVSALKVIAKDYYTTYGYPWEKQDTNIQFNLYTTITRNAPVKYDFEYKILRPQTIVNNYTDNSINYGKYIQFGLSMPVYKFTQDSIKLNALNKLSLKLDYIFPKGSVGLNWQPQGNVVGIEFSATLIKFKQHK
jgi:hypothetical protein